MQLQFWVALITSSINRNCPLPPFPCQCDSKMNPHQKACLLRSMSCCCSGWQLSSKWRILDSRPQGCRPAIKQLRSVWTAKRSTLVSSCREWHLPMRQTPLSLRLKTPRPTIGGELCKGAFCRFGRCRRMPAGRHTLFCHSCRDLQDVVRPGHWPKQYDVKQMLWVSRLLMHTRYSSGAMLAWHAVTLCGLMQRDALAGVCTGCMAIPQTVCKSDVHKFCLQTAQDLLTRSGADAILLSCRLCCYGWPACSVWSVLLCCSHLRIYAGRKLKVPGGFAHPHPWQAQQVLSRVCSLFVHVQQTDRAGWLLQDILQLMHTRCLLPTTASNRAVSKSAEQPYACSSCAPPATDRPAMSQHRSSSSWPADCGCTAPQQAGLLPGSTAPDDFLFRCLPPCTTSSNWAWRPPLLL